MYEQRSPSGKLTACEPVVRFLGGKQLKPQVKPEHGRYRAKSPQIARLGPKSGVKIRAKTAQNWVERGARICWLLAPAIFACSAV